MDNIEFWSVIVLLIGIIAIQNIIHKQERKDLYNRIMARDLAEYKTGGKRSVPCGIRKRAAEESDRRNKPE